MMASGMRADAYPVQWRPARLRPRTDAAPASRSQRLRHRHDGCLSRGGMEERNLEFGAALAHAVNDWQIHDWVEKDRRLKAGIVVPQEYPEFAVREIDARAAENEAFRQVIVSPRVERAARPAQILADLRGHRAQQSRARPASGRRAGRPSLAAAPAGAPITCRSITPSAPASPATSSA